MYNKEYYQAHKEEIKAKKNAYYQAHKEEVKARVKAWREEYKEQMQATEKAWIESNKEHCRDYRKADINANGQTKTSIRSRSQYYLSKYGTKIPGYEIHHCSGYTEPYKFIYCSIEMHKLIHAYLRQHNIDADSEHYAQIKHLLDDTVVLYGLE